MNWPNDIISHNRLLQQNLPTCDIGRLATAKQKAARRRLFNSNPMIEGQADIIARFDFLR
jgi:hypothetical protein